MEKVRIKGIETVLEILSEKRQSSILLQGLNATVTKVRREIISRIKDQYNITRQKDLEMDIKRANKHNYTATIEIPKISIPLSRFKPHQTATGTRIEIKRGSQKEILHAFTATMKSGHTGVYQRARYVAGKEGNTMRKSTKEAIYERYTIGPANMYLARKISSYINRYATDTLHREIVQRLKVHIANMRSLKQSMPEVS